MPTQGFPPKLGLGFAHLLRKVIVPIPHDLEQPDDCVHSVHLPSTEWICSLNKDAGALHRFSDMLDLLLIAGPSPLQKRGLTVGP